MEHKFKSISQFNGLQMEPNKIYLIEDKARNYPPYKVECIEVTKTCYLLKRAGYSDSYYQKRSDFSFLGKFSILEEI